MAPFSDKGFKSETCFDKGIPYCSREEEDECRTVEYREKQLGKQDETTLNRDGKEFCSIFRKGLDEFFYISNDVCDQYRSSSIESLLTDFTERGI